MTKYHISPAGESGVCKARKSCPFGDLEKDHYGSEAEARGAYEERMAAVEFPLMKLRVYDYELLKDANLVKSEFTVKAKDGALSSFQSFKEAVDYSISGGKLEIVGVTKPAAGVAPPKESPKKQWGTLLNDYEEDQQYDSSKGLWVYSSKPNIDRPKTDHQKAVAAYWQENFSYWNTAWLNPDEAEGRCVDSAEDFAKWAKAKGHKVAVLDVYNDDGDAHTVTIFRDPVEGEVVVDFTARQFDSEAPVPNYETRASFMASREWKLNAEEEDF